MSCVPCPCDALGVTGRVQCPILTNLMEDPPRLGQLYAAGVNVIDAIPILLKGVDTSLQSAVTPWFMKIGVALSLPWMVTLFIILYIMYIKSIIDYDLFIVCVLCILFVVGCALVYLYTVVSLVIDDIKTETITPIIENWYTNKNDIITDIISSYIGCAYCQSETIGCTSSCGGICSGVCE